MSGPVIIEAGDRERILRLIRAVGSWLEARREEGPLSGEWILVIYGEGVRDGIRAALRAMGAEEDQG